VFALLVPSQVSLMASALVVASWVIGARLDAASPIGRGLAAPLAAGGMVFAAAWFAVVAVPGGEPGDDHRCCPRDRELGADRRLSRQLRGT